MLKSEMCDRLVGTWYCNDCDNQECRCSDCDYLDIAFGGTWVCVYYPEVKAVTEIECCEEWRHAEFEEV